ncbi:SMI1/KNR4 family protein [Brevundimonas sp. LjRoot202]|uniref:SMI1/KNR4 family protein n=1 Tax=Brevundimonas sp. LjRoot202 TaxID=3342281 RepID=UPI003ECE7640
MPFPVDPGRIAAAEHALDFVFPAAWRCALERLNGGEFELGGEDWQVYPVWDDSDRKRAGRTANDVRYETGEARKWHGFPPNAVALAGNGHGDLLVAVPGSASVCRWDHEEELIEDLGDLDPLALMDDAE